jgi:hypothetical protein
MGETHAKFADDHSHDVEYFGISSSGDVSGVVAQNSIQESGDQVDVDTV